MKARIHGSTNTIGGKMMQKRLRITVFIVIMLMLFLTACSFGVNNKAKDMDVPPVSYIDEGEVLPFEDEEENEGEENASPEGSANEEEELVQRELYLIDANGLVVPQTFELPKTESVLRQALEYLVADGPISDILPNGFQAVLPPGTSVDVNLKEDGLVIVDFSTEFNDYDPEKELQIVQAITWTLTQFDNVDKVKIQINGYEQKTMPKNGTPIGEGLSRENGINLETGSVTDIVASKGVTLYFLSQYGDNLYYVPVTRRIPAQADMITASVNELLKGPSITSPLLTDFRQGVELLDEPRYANGQVTLNFNESILSELQSTAISNEVLNMLVFTLTEQEGIESVAIEVNGEASVLSEDGKMIEPVFRPALINTERH